MSKEELDEVFGGDSEGEESGEYEEEEEEYEEEGDEEYEEEGSKAPAKEDPAALQARLDAAKQHLRNKYLNKLLINFCLFYSKYKNYKTCLLFMLAIKLSFVSLKFNI